LALTILKNLSGRRDPGKLKETVRQVPVTPEIGNIGTGPDTKINFGGFGVNQDLEISEQRIKPVCGLFGGFSANGDVSELYRKDNHIGWKSRLRCSILLPVIER
jgi:hypothetical protein